MTCGPDASGSAERGAQSEAIERIREGLDSLSKLVGLAESADRAGKRGECRNYLFQICTVGAALADFAGLRAEAFDSGTEG